MLLVASACFTACSSDDDPGLGGGGGNSEDDLQKKAITEDYVDKVVLPTYALMKDRAWDLYDAMKVFNEMDANDPDRQEAFKACGDAWRAMREPWEESEAFLYGPADGEKLDPSLDSWPLDQSAIDTYVGSTISINYEDLQAGLSVNVKGFHTIEYFLFDNGTYADASQLTARKKHYLFSITKLLRDNTIQLWAAWHGDSELDERDQEVLDGENSEDWDNPDTEEGTPFGWGAGAYRRGYGNSFKTPSLTGNSFGYKTFSDCLDQIIDGCTNICSEVGEQKIGNPYDLWRTGQTEEAVYQVESWYSWNSLEDYANNIYSIRNSYYGGRNLETPSSHSISAYVAAHRPELDTQVKEQIEKTIQAIHAIPHPFRNNLDKTTEISNAQSQLATLSDLLTRLKAVWN